MTQEAYQNDAVFAEKSFPFLGHAGPEAHARKGRWWPKRWTTAPWRGTAWPVTPLFNIGAPVRSLALCPDSIARWVAPCGWSNGHFPEKNSKIVAALRKRRSNRSTIVDPTQHNPTRLSFVVLVYLSFDCCNFQCTTRFFPTARRNFQVFCFSASTMSATNAVFVSCCIIFWVESTFVNS